MNLDNFIVRPQGAHVGRFRERKAWDGIDEGPLTDLREPVAGLPSERDPEHITAKLLDLVCLNLQLAPVNRTTHCNTCRDRNIERTIALYNMGATKEVTAKTARIPD